MITKLSILSNSSKHIHDPAMHNPFNYLIICVCSNNSLQFNIIHCFANDFVKSFIVSVLPVPAGPSAHPP